MALDRRKMHFVKGVVLTQAQEAERQKNAPKYKIKPGTLIAIVAGLTCGLPPRR